MDPKSPQRPPSDLLAHNALASVTAMYGAMLVEAHQRIQMLEGALRSLSEASRRGRQDGSSPGSTQGQEGSRDAGGPAPVSARAGAQAGQAPKGQEEGRDRVQRVGQGQEVAEEVAEEDRSDLDEEGLGMRMVPRFFAKGDGE